MLRQLNGHTDFVFSVDWSPDGRRLLSASRDSTLILWDPLEGRALRTFRDEAGRSFTASFLDDRHAVSGGSSSDVRFWSLFDERELRHIVVDGSPIYSMVFSSDEQMVLVGQQDTIRLLELATGDELRRFHFAGGAVMSIALSPDDRIVYGGFEDNSVIAWDVTSGDELRRFEGHTATFINENVTASSILGLAVSPDNQRLLSGAEDKTMLVWDTDSGRILHRFENCSGTINGGDFSPDGSLMAGGFGALKDPTRGPCSDVDFSIHLWDVQSGDLVRRFEGHADAVVVVRFSPDGRRLISGSIDETVRLWDVETGKELRRFIGHTAGVLTAAFSADGRYVVSGSNDGFVIVWDVETGDLLRQLTGHSDNVNSVRFALDTDTLWTSSNDGSVRQWSLLLEPDALSDWVTRNRHVRNLTCSERMLYLLDGGCE
jgi:WD40 repeat protein